MISFVFIHVHPIYVPFYNLSNPPSDLCSTYHTSHTAMLPPGPLRVTWLQCSLQPLFQQSSWSELLLCVSTAGLLEQGQASQHLSCQQFSVDFVVPRTHIDTVSHLLLLSDHCQGTHTTARHRPVHTIRSYAHTSLALCCWIHAWMFCLSQKMIMEWKLEVTLLFWVN